MMTDTPEKIWAYAGTFKMWGDHKTDALHTQTEYTRTDIAEARIAELEAAIKRQAGAAKRLRTLTLSEVQHIKDNERKEYVATETLESERDANAILTDEVDALRAKLDDEAKATAKEVAVWDENCRIMQARIAELEEALIRLRSVVSPIPSEDTERYREEYEACEIADAALKVGEE